jgi:hypothetical protein
MTGVIIPAAVFTHIALTYDRSQVVLYVNGVQVYAVDETNAIATTASPLYIGQMSGGDLLRGRLDNVRLYNRALSGSEIQDDMTTPATPLIPGTFSEITIEAESMARTGYRMQRNADASCGQLISRQTASGPSLGMARAKFPGTTGIYDVIVFYFDENDGRSTLKFLVNGVVIDRWIANADLPASRPGAVTLVYRVVARGISLAYGDIIQLTGRRHRSEYASIDRIDFVPVLRRRQIIVDNKAANTSRTGMWTVSRATNPWAGQSLDSRTSTATFRWIPSLPVTGAYKVYAWWTAAPSRSTTVPYRIFHKSGLATVTVNQREPQLNGQWHLLGTFRFAAGSSGYVEVSGANGQANADAVRFVKQ